MKINTELCCKRYDFLTKKTQNYRYHNYCPDDNIQIYSYGLLLRTRLEHAHCLETINNMWFLGKRETVNAWKKADFDGFREKDELMWSSFQMQQMQDICRGSVGPLEWTQGSATHPKSRWICKYFVWYVSRTCFFLLFSIVFHILWIYDDAYDHFR